MRLRFKKTVALFVSFIFVTISLAPAGFANAGSSFETDLFLTKALQIPSEFGQITDRVIGPLPSPALIHIQSAHGNYEAERNIEKVLNYLKENASMKLVLLEGAASGLRPDTFRIFPEQPAFNRKVTDKLIQEGYLTGPEDLLIHQDDGWRVPRKGSSTMQAFGIEDLEAYKKDRDVFINIMKRKKASERIVGSLHAGIDKQFSSRLNRDLRSFVRQEEAFGSGTLSLDAWLRVLDRASRKHLRLNLSDAFYQDQYPFLVRYDRLQAIHSRIHREKALIEAKAFLQELEKRAVPNDIILSFKTLLNMPEPELLKAGNGYSALRLAFDRALTKLPRTFSMRSWPSWTLYAQYVILMQEIDAKRLYDETGKLKDRILGVLAQTPAEKEYLARIRELYLSKRLFELALTRTEYEELRARKITPSSALFAEAMRFYELALDREGRMFRNALKTMEALKQNRAVIVTGGFHTEGLKERIVSQGYSYLQITPRIGESSKRDHQIYLRSMLGSRGFKISQITALLGIADARQRMTVTGPHETKEWYSSVAEPIRGLIRSEPVSMQPALFRALESSLIGSRGVPAASTRRRSEVRIPPSPVQTRVPYPDTKLRIAMVQMNPIVGDLIGNYEAHLEFLTKAKGQDADIVIFPELSISGYLPEDLVHKQHFIRQNKEMVVLLAKQVYGITAIVGFVDYDDEGRLYNAAAVVADGEIKGIYHKWDLPNYVTFDEKRYFTPGTKPFVFTVKGLPIGLNICEDIWNDRGEGQDVYVEEARLGARLQINISASPFHMQKLDPVRRDLLRKRTQQTGSLMVYNNLLGGQDEVVFDGGSMIMQPDGTLLAQGKQFQTELIVTDVDFTKAANPIMAPSDLLALEPGEHSKEKIQIESPEIPPVLDSVEEARQAIIAGIRDYMRKNGFKKAILGLSGGIDSAVTAALAVEAIGKENVKGISMPTRYNSPGTKTDARRVAEHLGIEFEERPIQGIFTFFLGLLTTTSFTWDLFFNSFGRWLYLMPYFGDIFKRLAMAGFGALRIPEENLQARIRGMILMYESNKSTTKDRTLILTTGNKSETGVGYCTLYGDMAGGYAPIKDAYKTVVFGLARRINHLAQQEVIPPSTIERPPSAELNVNQKDEDSLPSYETELDPMLKLLLEKNASTEDLAVVAGMRQALTGFNLYSKELHQLFANLVFKSGNLDKALSEAFRLDAFDEELLRRMAQKYGTEKAKKVIRLVDIAEYKRRQGPPGPKLTPLALGRDRRMPITNGYHEDVIEAWLADQFKRPAKAYVPERLKGPPRKIGIFGGTFSPVTRMHLAVAEAAHEKLKLDEVILIPTNKTPDKSNEEFVSGGTRLQMTLEAVRELPAGFRISGYEVREGGDSFTVETLRHFREKYPEGSEFFLIVGDDRLPTIPRWRESAELLQMAKLVAVTLDERPVPPLAGVEVIRITVPDTGTLKGLHATQVREMMAAGNPGWEFFVPPRVAAFIKSRKLYSVRSELRAQERVAQMNQERPKGYPARDVDSPPTYTARAVIRNAASIKNPFGWAHPDLSNPRMKPGDRKRMIEQIRADILRFAPHTAFDQTTGLPVNREETGLKGRGLLGRYGPNQAEDAVLLRYNKQGKLEILVVDRRDGGVGVALPGGFAKRGEETKFGVTATREFEQETQLEIDLTRGKIVYEGPSHDWRDTNDAWVITRGAAVLLSWEESQYFRPKGRDDAKNARFVEVTDNLRFYAGHRTIVENAMAMVQSGQITVSEDVVNLKNVDITLPQLEEAYQLFKEGKHEGENASKTYDVTVPQAPHGGSYTVFAGLEETLASIHRRRFTPGHIEQLRKLDKFSGEFLEYLKNFIFEGDIDALQEGTVVQQGIPLMRIQANPVEMALLKGLIQNRLGFSTNIATKAARIAQAANGDFVTKEQLEELRRKYGLTPEQVKKVRAVIDFGLRRGQGWGSMVATLATIIGGAIATSNMKAAKQFYLDPSGTMAHLFVSFFPPEEEEEAFRIWGKLFPKTSVFLLDTYDTIEAAKKAVKVALEMKTAGGQLVGVRLDSGDLVILSQEVRKIFDAAGLYDVKIFASNDLDEFVITDLIARGARLDGFGVGTNMITGGKQGALELEIKESGGERIWRARHRGRVQRYIKTAPSRIASASYAEEVEELLKPYWRHGMRTYGSEKPWKAHERAIAELGQMKPEQKKLSDASLLQVDFQANPLTINPETDAVLVVDAQKAFMKSGGLAVKEGGLIMPFVRALLDRFPKLRRFASLDKHPKGHISFASSFVGIPAFTYLTYDTVKDWTETDHKIAPHALFTLEELKAKLQRIGGQMLWPDHAGYGTFEAALHPDMLREEFAYVITKGMTPATDSYSAFFDNEGKPTGLADELRKRGVKRIFIVGLAYDYCVGWSAEGAVKEGFQVVVVQDGTKPVGFPPDSIAKMDKSLSEKGVAAVSTQEVLDANDHRGVTIATRLDTPITHPDFPEEEESTALEEDMYHVRMGEAFFRMGMHQEEVTFNYFFRNPPYGEDHVVVSGLRFLLKDIQDFRFTEEQIEYLKHIHELSNSAPVDPAFIEFLRDFRFRGEIMGLPEGSNAYPQEPILRIRGTILETMIIETFVLKRMNFNSLIATLANVTRKESGNQIRLILDALETAHGAAHKEAAYSAFVGGIDATTDVDAAIAFKIPLADRKEDGKRLGSELVTGGTKTALGGVFKLTKRGKRGIVKLSESKAKTTYPGDQEVAAVFDAQGKAVRRVTRLEGERLARNAGEKVRSRYVTMIQRGGDVVYEVPDAFDVRAFHEADEARFADIHATEISPRLQALRERAVQKIRRRSEIRTAAEKEIRLPEGIEAVSGRTLQRDQPYVILLDLHGTIFKPTWPEEFTRLHRYFMKSSLNEAREWVAKNSIKDLIQELTRVSGQPREKVIRELIKIRRYLWRAHKPETMEGAYEFVKALREREVPVVLLTGSDRAFVIHQLSERGFLELVSEEMIIARDDALRSKGRQVYTHQVRGDAIKSLRYQFPNHTFLSFDDGIEAHQAVRELDGFNFGLPQGEGEVQAQNRERLVSHQADFILTEGFKNWRGLLRYLRLNSSVQRKAVSARIPVYEKPAVELSFVLPAPRHGGLKLHIDVGEDLGTLTYSEVVNDQAVYRRDGTADYTELRLRPLRKFPSSHLISPLNHITHALPPGIRRAIMGLWSKGKRYTRYRGITTSWDMAVDRDVWATSIDTVMGHRVLEDSELLQKLGDVRKVGEVGVGAGHISTLMAILFPGLKELDISDISIHALRAAKRNILPFLQEKTRLRTFLGQGLGKMSDGLDLLFVNPPYIPIPPFEEGTEIDPYRGTGLIREIVERGVDRLNKKNPEASVVINISSLAQRDFDAYVRQYGERLLIEPLFEKPVEVPFKVRWISEGWKKWLVDEGLLERRRVRGPEEEPYWHKLQFYRLRLKPVVRSEVREEENGVSSRGFLRTAREVTGNIFAVAVTASKAYVPIARDVFGEHFAGRAVIPREFKRRWPAFTAILTHSTAAGATASSRGPAAVPARGSRPRAGGGDAERSRPLTTASDQRMVIDQRRGVPVAESVLPLVTFSLHDPKARVVLALIAEAHEVSALIKKLAALNPEGSLPQNFRVQAFSNENEFVRAFAELYNRSAPFGTSVALVTDRENSVITAKISSRRHLLSVVGGLDPLKQTASALLAVDKLLDESIWSMSYHFISAERLGSLEALVAELTSYLAAQTKVMASA